MKSFRDKETICQAAWFTGVLKNDGMGTPLNRSALLAAILERQNLLQERWDDFYRSQGLGALAFLPENYEKASSPDDIHWEYWTAEQIDRYLKLEGGLSDVGKRWFGTLPRQVQRGFAAVIISNDGDPTTEDVHFYKIGG